MIYEYECSVCGARFIEGVPILQRDEVFHCKVKASRIIVQPFHTDPDRAYKFIADGIKKKPVQIKSKGHYKRLLKESGMIDASPTEGRQEALIKKKGNEKKSKENRIKLAEKINKELHQAGINKHIKGALQNRCVKKDCV